MSSVSRMTRVYGVAMVDDRRRPLRDDELARIARAIDPRARATYCAPLLGGLDAATYALDLEIAGEHRAVVVRIFTLPVHRDGAAARRYWKAITGIPVNAPVLVPRPVHLDAEGALVGLPCMVMTRLPGTPLARPANEDSWIDQLAGAVASIHGVDVKGLPSDYPRAPGPVELVETRLTYWSPKMLQDLWRDVAAALRSAAPRVTSNGMVLTHGDFWFGNTLWSDDHLTGIVDWDDAKIHDPGFDIGYARGDLQLVLGGTAPGRFLARYEARRGKVRSIAFWDLVSTLPAFRWLDDWVAGYREVGRSELTDDLARERLASFVREALRAL
jgi:aminoglycoside phosphotransferase (APT) family kinase protein